MPLVFWATVSLSNAIASAGDLSVWAIKFQSSPCSISIPSQQDTTSRTRIRWITPQTTTDSSGTAPDLPEESYRLQPITVIGIRQKITRVINPVVVTIDENGSSDSVIDALRHLPAVFMKSYGGAGSVHSLSTNGGAAAHTTVILDGITLNSPQNGELDFSSVPLGLIGEIEYVPHGGFAAYSTTGLSGIVNLSPSEPVTGAAYTAGSFGRQELRTSLLLGKLLSLQIGTVDYAGDFAYYFREQNHRRQNNEFHQQYAFLDSRWSRLRWGDFNIRLWLVDSRKEVPGQVWSPNSDSQQWDKWYLLTTTRRWSRTSSQYLLRMYRHESYERYLDPRLAVASRHRLAVSGLQFEKTIVHREWLAGFTRYELRNETLNSTDAKHHVLWRLDYAYQLLLEPWKRISLLPIVYLSARPDSAFAVTGDIAFQYQPYNNQSILESVTVLAGKNIRYPTFNDLYWEPGGNPSLESETATTSGIKTSWQFGPQINVVLNSVHIRYRDLIKWSLESDGLWRPSNISAATSLSLTAQVDFRFFGDRLGIDLGWDEIITQNLEHGSHYGKPLRFAPRHTAKLLVEIYGQTDWCLSLQALAISAYLTAYNYPHDNTQPPVLTCNAQIYRQFLLRRGAITITLGIKNILDQRYEFIPGYPEQGRSINLTISLERRSHHE
ncbi:MAG: TonB-dependent receptor [Fidelibacterota bacterium]|nr:MAG: TonB-dependent receptor [Candidatus Neomarinimicrobiota bacterium]